MTCLEDRDRRAVVRFVGGFDALLESHLASIAPSPVLGTRSITRSV